MARNILLSSLHNASYTIVFQIICRIITFGINGYIVRHVGREVLGVMNVRLLLLESTILFLSREAINRASLSATTSGNQKQQGEASTKVLSDSESSSSRNENQLNCSWAQLINQQWLTVVICMVVNVPCLYTWLHWLSPVSIEHREQYHSACYAIGISCILELCTESPLYISQVFCFVRLRIAINTIHIFVRSAIFLWIVLNDGSLAIWAFATAQLYSAFVFLICYYAYFFYYIKKLNAFRAKIKEMQVENTDEKVTVPKIFENMQDFPFSNCIELLPNVLQTKSKESFLNKNLQILTLSFIKQCFLKQILTEGERYVMSMSPVLSFNEQATYDIVNNLGSLVTRFIFQPIEENSYFYFSQTLERDQPLSKQSASKISESSWVLKQICMTVSTIGLMALVFGQSYSRLALQLYAGSDFVSTELPVTLLRWHSVAICFLALNGITEAYMFATNTSKDIDNYNYLMTIFSASFLLLSYTLTNTLGPVGFIVANCVNMFCRICYSVRFIRLRYDSVTVDNPLKGLIPTRAFLTTLISTGSICYYSAMYISSMAIHLLIGVVCVLIVLVIWLVENNDLVRYGWSYRKRWKRD